MGILVDRRRWGACIMQRVEYGDTGKPEALLHGE
jgi:hypothetical protein